MTKNAEAKGFGRSWRNSRRKWVFALNSLTSARIAITPILIILLFFNKEIFNWIALAIFIPFAFSDLLDGYLARRFDMANAVGKFLDPVADKVFVVSLVYCVIVFRDLYWLTEIAGLAIILREVIIPALRGFLSQVNVPLDVTVMAKWKTTMQMVAVGFIIVPEMLPRILGLYAGEWLLIIASVITIVSTYNYTIAAYSYFKKL